MNEALKINPHFLNIFNESMTIEIFRRLFERVLLTTYVKIKDIGAELPKLYNYPTEKQLSEDEVLEKFKTAFNNRNYYPSFVIIALRF